MIYPAPEEDSTSPALVTHPWRNSVLELVQKTSAATEALIEEVHNQRPTILAIAEAIEDGDTTKESQSSSNRPTSSTSQDDTFSGRLQRNLLHIRQQYWNLDAETDSIIRRYEDGDQDLYTAVSNLVKKLQELKASINELHQALPYIGLSVPGIGHPAEVVE